MGSQTISFKLDEWHRQIKEDWSRQGKSFGRHVDFPDGHAFDMSQGRTLGRGGFGYVRATKCEYEYHGKTRRTDLALKEYVSGDIQESIWREISILKRLQHRHVTEFVGSYSIDDNFYALFWPMAQFSLADVFDYLQRIGKSLEQDKIDPNTVYQDIPESYSWKKDVYHLAKFLPSTEENPVRHRRVQSIIDEVVRRLFGGLGCLAEALEYIHGQKVRHSDLKPANILMFPSNDNSHDCGPYDPDGLNIMDGIRITDFNLALGMGNHSFSRTHNTGGTVEYNAPEEMEEMESIQRNEIKGSGPPADVFSLGCIFLEILCMLSIEPVLADQSLKFCSPMSLDMPKRYGPCRCYSVNLESFDLWTTRLNETGGSPINQHLISLVESMMDENSDRRPIAKQVAIRLAVMEQLRKTERGGIGETRHSLFGRCCKPATFEREDYRLLRHVFPANIGGTDMKPQLGGDLFPHGSIDEPDVDTPATALSSAAPSVAIIDGGSPLSAIERRQPVAYWNRLHQRIDTIPIEYNHDEFTRVRGLKLCNNKYMLNNCMYGDSCAFNHEYEASGRDLRILRRILRSLRVCNFGLLCNDPICMFGHNCPNGTTWDTMTKTASCRYNGPKPKGKCLYPAELHDLDTKIAYCT